MDCLKAYPAMHIPTGIQITEQIGRDTSRDDMLHEILMLTKMNWNSARFGGSLPFTLRFAQAAAEILRELPEGVKPRPNFKFHR